MGFEYQQIPGKRIKTVTYTDEKIDNIYKRKSDLKVDVLTELDELKKLKEKTEAEYENACALRDSIADWDSDEYYQAEETCDDLWCKISTLDDIIDSLEDLNNVL